MLSLVDATADPRTRQEASDVLALPTFAAAAAAVLAHLEETFGGTWLATRVAGENQVVLASEGVAYPISAGATFRWSDSFCSRMAVGDGPRVAPRAMDVPSYAEAPVARLLPIGSYVGIPLTDADDALFGTLCGISPDPADESLLLSQPLFELLARLLSSVLRVELTAAAEARRADVAEQRAYLDSLTGTLNRRGWDAMLEAEEQRCRRHASPAAVVAVDLDDLKLHNDRGGHDAGDRLLETAGRVLQDGCRGSDVVARTGGDEFAVLCVETSEAFAQPLATRLQRLLQIAGVAASVGVAGRDPRAGGLSAAWIRADAVMYADKGLRRGALPDGVRRLAAR